MTRTPEHVIALDARQYPLDAACNPFAEERHEPSIACMAARAQLCFSDGIAAFSYAGSLFGVRRTVADKAVGFSSVSALSPMRIFELATHHMSTAKLETCMALPETEKMLREDIELAHRVGATSAPFVIVNGRRASAYAPFLEVMALTQGRGTHPAFSILPLAKGR